MPVLSPADARVHEHGGFTFTSLAVPSRGTTELALWTVEVPPGASSELHSMDREEVFWVAAGAVTAEGVGTAAAGEVLVVPAGTLFRLANPGPEPARLVAVTSAGMRATIGGRTFTPPWSL